MFRRLFLCSYSILFILFNAQGQSLLEKNYATIARSVNDTAAVNALNFLAKYHVNMNLDSSAFYAKKAEELAIKLNYPRGIAMSHVNLGIVESELGNFPESLELLLDGGSIAEKIEDYPILAGQKLNLGNFYFKTGDIDKSISTYREGIKICEDHGIYYTEASLYTSVGMGLKMKGELDSALYYYEKVLEIHYTKLHDSTVIAAVYNNIAALYFTKNDKKTAENYLLKSYEINKLMGNERYQVMNLANLAGMVGQMPGGDLEKANEYYEKAIELGKKMKSKDALQSIYEGMAIVHYNHEEFRDAFDYIMLSNAYKDSVLGEDKRNQILAISEEFKTKQIQDSLRIKDQEIALSRSNEEAANLKASKSTWQLIGVIFVLFGISVVLFFVYRNSKNQKRINALLQDKNEEINLQKIEIEQKNTELTDSINYAKRIQQALLPSSSYLSKILGDHFLIFKPKDIVSGDFYWVKQKNNKHYFAVADCTGHGVPGAMVSMLGFETIERVSTSEINDAADFVKQVNISLVHSLTGRKSDNTSQDQLVKDGMDLSLCIVSDKQKLSYCGANNECYVIRQNGLALPEASERIKLTNGTSHTVIELKPTKRPVGVYESIEEFQSIELQLLKGDIFYLFSDGYPDQFGGERGKKLKTSSFRDILLNAAHLTMDQQLKNLEDHLTNWQGNFDQLDDITVLGVKVE